MTATGSVASARAGMQTGRRSHLGVVLFTFPRNILGTVWFVSQIGALVHPLTAIAEAGTIALYIFGGMVNFVWHGGMDLGYSGEFASRRNVISYCDSLFKYIV